VDDFLDELSKTKRLQYDLLQELKKRNVKPHDLFFSETELVKLHNLNRSTVRQAVSKLVDEGYLYRISGKGTFVSPRPKTKQILIVSNYGEDTLRKGRYAIAEFISCITQFIKDEDLGYILVTIQPDEFLKISHDIELIYKQVSGILFFFDIAPLLKSKTVLDKKRLPYIYYGAEMNIPEDIRINHFVYSQREVVYKALNYLYEMGHRKIGIVYNKAFLPRVQRFEVYLQWMKEKDLPIEQNKSIIEIIFHYRENERKYIDFLNQMKSNPPSKEITAFFCVDDILGHYFINSIYRLGFKVPEEIAVIGVSNYPFCPELIIPLTSVEIPFSSDGKKCFQEFVKYIENPSGLINLKSKISIIERESTLKI